MKTMICLFLMLRFVVDVQGQLTGDQPAPRTKRLLVVSGGGARGAWGVGLVKYLADSLGHYQMVVGTSTGALMAPFVALKEYDHLDKAYTSVTQRSIFNANPFNTKTGDIKLWGYRRIFSRTLGRTDKLKGLIGREMPDTFYQRILNDSTLNFGVAVANLRTHEVVYQFAKPIQYVEKGDTITHKGHSRAEMIEWIWASANEPVFMSLHETKKPDGHKDYWVDGGLRENVPVVKGLRLALDKDFDAVDVIINNPVATVESESVWPNKKRGTKIKQRNPKVLKAIAQSFKTYRSGVRDMNIEMGDMLDRLSEFEQMQPTTTPVSTRGSGPNNESEAARPVASNDRITLTFYFLPDRLYQIIPNELLFDSVKMDTLLKAGRRGEFTGRRKTVIAPDGTRQPVPQQQQQKPVQYQMSKEALKRALDQIEK